MADDSSLSMNLLLKYIRDVFPAFLAYKQKPSPESFAALSKLFDPWCREAISVIRQYQGRCTALGEEVGLLQAMVTDLKVENRRLEQENGQLKKDLLDALESVLGSAETQEGKQR